MIHTLRGKITGRGDNFFVLECGGVGFKVFTNQDSLEGMKSGSDERTHFCYMHVRENAIELYGFPEEGSLKLFEMLIGVSGVGPKTALAVLDVDSVPNVVAAIIEKRAELLTRASGTGRKTAERIILDLHGKVKLPGAHALTQKMDADIEVEEALVSLGYSRGDVKRALTTVPAEHEKLEDRLRQTLKALAKKTI